VLFKISVLCQSVGNWQCNAHQYCLREVRCLMNHISNMYWSRDFFAYIQITHFRASLTPCSVCPDSDLNTATGDTVLPLLWIAVCGELFDFVLVYRTRRRHHHSVVYTIDYFHHSIILKYAVLCLSSLPLPHSFHLLDNIFNHYDDPNSDIGIVYFGMWVPHPFYPLMESCYSYHDLKTI